MVDCRPMVDNIDPVAALQYEYASPPSQSPPVREGDQNCLLRLRVPTQEGKGQIACSASSFAGIPPARGPGGGATLFPGR